MRAQWKAGFAAAVPQAGSSRAADLVYVFSNSRLISNSLVSQPAMIKRHVEKRAVEADVMAQVVPHNSHGLAWLTWLAVGSWQG
jgi:hypothetical protein